MNLNYDDNHNLNLCLANFHQKLYLLAQIAERAQKASIPLGTELCERLSALLIVDEITLTFSFWPKAMGSGGKEG